MSIKKFLLSLFIFGFAHQLHAQSKSSFAVVELFTSEGCSTCPPAESFLSTISTEAKKNHTSIFCLEYHVDYWNKAGWKDPYSSFLFTKREQNYTSVLGEKELYTPMMLVNGETCFVGTDSAKANAAISKALKTISSLSIFIKIDSVKNDTAFVIYKSSSTDKNYSLRFVSVERKLISKVTKGENSGKILTHDNVVRNFFTVELKEKSGAVQIPLKGFKPNSNCELIAFVQHKQSMKMLAVTGTAF